MIDIFARTFFCNRPVSSAGNNTTIGAGGLGFHFRVGQIRQSVANGSPPLRRFFGAMLPKRYVAEMSPATRYMIRFFQMKCR